MPIQVNPNDINTILQVIQKLPWGAGIAEIAKQLRPPLAKRTLQRRLNQLVNTQMLRREGKGKSCRYFYLLQVHSPTAPNPFKPAAHTRDGMIPTPILSSESKRIKDYVKLPIQKRKPVGYNRHFLDHYKPNHSSYLTPTICQHLDSIGRSHHNMAIAGSYAKQIFHRLLIDLAWNSSRLEGNTYSLLETERLLQQGEVADGKKIFETQMLLNHKAAMEFLVENAAGITINRYTLLNLHALLANNLLSNPGACGRLRTIPVGIAHTCFYPLAVPQLVEECFQQIVDTTQAIINPFEQAFFIMVQLPYLQAFEDVNKRVSRLAANIPFIQKNYAPLAFIDVSEQSYIDGILGVYELNKIELLRDVFIFAYERSAARYAAVQQSLGEPDLFRLRHHTIISETIFHVVNNRLDKKVADAFIKQQAHQHFASQLRHHFVEVVETELLNLHEGNIARYKIPLATYQKWHPQW